MQILDSKPNSLISMYPGLWQRRLLISVLTLGLTGGLFPDLLAQEPDADSSTAMHPLEGSWLGSMKFGKFKMKLRLNLESRRDGTLKSTMDLVSQGRKGIPVQAILFNEPEVLFEIDAFEGSYRGTVGKENSEIQGEWDMRGAGLAQVKTTFVRVAETTAAESLVDYAFSKDDLKHIRGFWKGTIKPRPDMEITMILKIGQSPDGSYQGAMDVPNQAAANIPLSSVDYAHPGVIIKWTAGNAEFTFNLTDDFMTLNGEMKQQGMEFPVSFARHHPKDLEKSKEVLSFESPKGAPDIRGNWEAILKVQNTEIRLGVAIGKNETGEFRSVMSMVDQGLNKLPASETLFRSPELTIRWSGIGHAFEGRFSEDGQNLVGSWKMGPLSSDVIFERKKSP